MNSNFCRKLGVFGWTEDDENVVLSSYLTGDGCLFVGRHGTAKTYLLSIIAKALGLPFVHYDASKSMFEDVLGFPNIDLLKQGKIEYIPSALTVWDKKILILDEVNRCDASMQSKWLELLRSKRIMGLPTQVRFIFGAMNPIDYAGGNVLDEAFLGRFASIIMVPEIADMEEEERIQIAKIVNADDCSGLSFWTGEATNTISDQSIQSTGKELHLLFGNAGQAFNLLKAEMKDIIPEFVSKFSSVLLHESKGNLRLDGRRIAYIVRNILAHRAIQATKATMYGIEIPEFNQMVRHVLLTSIPMGLNDSDASVRENCIRAVETSVDIMSPFLDENGDLSKLNLIYELFTTKSLARKTEILLTEDIEQFIQYKAWNGLIESSQDITHLALTALRVEAKYPGKVPNELLAALSARIAPVTQSSSIKIEHEESSRFLGRTVDYLYSINGDDEKSIIAINILAEEFKQQMTCDRLQAAFNRIEEEARICHRLVSN